MTQQVQGRKLDNGFTYYISRRTDKPGRVFIKLNVKAGTYMKDSDQSADVAHLLEHVNFRSTEHFPEGNSPKDYMKTTGTGVNGHPGTHHTEYYVEAPSDSNVIRNILFIYQEWLSGRTIITNRTVEAEKQILVEETNFFGRGSGFGALIKLLKPSEISQVYEGYASTGKPNISTAAVKRFYNDWYRPDLAGVIIVGDVDLVSTDAMVKRMFAGLKNPVPERPRVVKQYVLTGQNKFVTYTRDTKEEAISLNLYFVRPAEAKASWNDYRDESRKLLFNAMLGNRFSNGSKSDVPITGVVEEGISYANSLNVASLVLATKCKDKNTIESGLIRLYTEAERIKRFGFNNRELDSVRTTLLTEFSADTIESFSKEVGRLSRSFIYGEVAPDITVLREMQCKFFREISLNEINEFAKSWIIDHDRYILMGIPSSMSKRGLPDEATALRWINEIQESNISPYKIPQVKERRIIVDFDSHYRIPSETRYSRDDNPRQDTIRLLLANGVRVSILGKKDGTFESRIRVEGTRPVGASGYSNRDYGVARYCPRIVLNGGLGELDAETLKLYAKQHNVDIKTEVNDLTSSISGRAPEKELEVFLQLVYRSFLVPERNDSARVQAMDDLRNNRFLNSKDYVLEDLSRLAGYRITTSTVPWLSAEDVEVLDYNKGVEIYRRIFSNPQEFSFLVTGVGDVEKTIDLVARYLGNLPVHQEGSVPLAKVGSIKEGFNLSKTITYKNLNKGRAEVTVLYGGYSNYSDTERLRQQVLGDVVRISCLRRLREKEAGTYAVNAGIRTQCLPGRNVDCWYEMRISFVCSPNSSRRLIDAVQEEVESIKKNGPELADFEAASKGTVGITSANIREAANQYLKKQYFLSLIELGKKK